MNANSGFVDARSRLRKQVSCAICVCGSMLFFGFAAQSRTPQAAWTESLGEPTIYLNYARANVVRQHFKSAARNIRRAAADLSQRSHGAYGLDRKRLLEDIEALRLTARDVDAGAVKSPAQLESVLESTHAAVAAAAR